MANVPSPYQVAIYKAVRKAKSNILVKAVAGAGKTTTTLGALDYVGVGESVCMLAFNVDIAAETRNRIGDLNRERADAGEGPVNATSRTLNSEGNTCVRNAGFGGGNVDKMKMWTLARTVVPFAQRNITAAVVALARAARTHGMVPANFDKELDEAGLPPAKGLIPDTVEQWRQLANRYEIEISSPRPVEIDKARELLRKALLEVKVRIDYDDQIYLPIVFDLPMTQYDWVFVDEAQDLNDANLVFLSKIGKKFMFVGDESQSLYAFRGADADAMQRIRQKFNCEVLPLSITYRCPVSVVNAAKVYDPAIEARPGAPMGEVANKGSARNAEFKPGDMVVCRFNAPLVQLAFSMIARNIPIQMRGSDIVSGVAELIKNIDAQSVESLLTRLSPWVTAKVERYIAADDEAKAIALLDKANMIRTVAEESGRVKYVDDIVHVMEDLFRSDGHEAVTLSSIHKAKGLECGTIWWLNPNLTPKVKTKSAHQQELNARYVATTRAKNNLFYVSLDAKKGKRADRIAEGLNSLKALSEKLTNGNVENEEDEVVRVLEKEMKELAVDRNGDTRC